jgi:hypothetical protein
VTLLKDLLKRKPHYARFFPNLEQELAVKYEMTTKLTNDLKEGKSNAAERMEQEKRDFVDLVQKIAKENDSDKSMLRLTQLFDQNHTTTAITTDINETESNLSYQDL